MYFCLLSVVWGCKYPWDNTSNWLLQTLISECKLVGQNFFFFSLGVLGRIGALVLQGQGEVRNSFEAWVIAWGRVFLCGRSQQSAEKWSRPKSKDLPPSPHPCVRTTLNWQQGGLWADSRWIMDSVLSTESPWRPYGGCLGSFEAKW